MRGTINNDLSNSIFHPSKYNAIWFDVVATDKSYKTLSPALPVDRCYLDGRFVLDSLRFNTSFYFAPGDLAGSEDRRHHT